MSSDIWRAIHEPVDPDAQSLRLLTPEGLRQIAERLPPGSMLTAHEFVTWLRIALDEDRADAQDAIDHPDGGQLSAGSPPPQWVLDDVAAKLAILDLHSLTHDTLGRPICSRCAEEYAGDLVGEYPCETLQWIAWAHREGHPGYRDEWRPTNVALMIEQRRHGCHRCVRPGCTARALVAYHVDRPLRLAGRDWRPGEFVDLCPDHDLELRRAACDAADAHPAEHLARLADGGVCDPLHRFREWAPE